LQLLAEELLEKEVLLKSDLERLIGPRPLDKTKEENKESVQETPADKAEESHN
jgi:hypothetical protein